MTEQVAHTPGPWTYEYPKHEGAALILAAAAKGANTRGQIAAVWRQPAVGDSEANARLIAAAPELLACLKEALELIQEDIDSRDGRDNFGMCCGRCDGAIPVEHSFGCRAKAAISKAETGQ